MVLHSFCASRMDPKTLFEVVRALHLSVPKCFLTTQSTPFEVAPPLFSLQLYLSWLPRGFSAALVEHLV